MERVITKIMQIFLLLFIAIQVPGVAYAKNTKSDWEIFKNALEKNDYNKVEELIKNGFDVNEKSSYSYLDAPLHLVQNENKEIAALLIKAGADVNAKNQLRDTPLNYASKFKDKDIAEMLIKAGADVNAMDDFGNTPLYNSYGTTNRELIAMLIKAGADVNAKDKDGYTQLIKAASFANKEFIARLIKAGADVNAKSNDGYTALIRSGSNHLNKDVLAFLIKSGADVKAETNDGNTALLEAVSGMGDSGVENVALLIKAGADVNAKLDNGRTQIETPLIWAARLNSKKIVAMLLKAGADVNAKVDINGTPLMYAAESGFNEIVAMLLKAGADASQLIQYKSCRYKYCLENGYFNEDCLNKMQLTFENKSSKRFSTLTIMLEISDGKSTLYKKKHTIAINIDGGETGACKEFNLSQNVYVSNAKLQVNVEVLSAK